MTMVNALGANVKFPDKRPTFNPRWPMKRTPQQTEADRMKFAPMKTTFINPKTNEDIYVLLDTCHMLKLALNLLSETEKGIKIPGFSHPAKWSYITELFEYQNRKRFRLGNKLTKSHVDISTHKMKIVFAAQVLSNSTADALRQLRDELKHPKVKLIFSFVEKTRLNYFALKYTRSSSSSEVRPQRRTVVNSTSYSPC